MIDVHGMLEFRSVHLNSGGEAGKGTAFGITRALTVHIYICAAVVIHREPGVFRVDGVTAVTRRCGKVSEVTSSEFDTSHRPHGDMVDERAVVLTEEIVVVHGEYTSVEVTLVVDDIACREWLV